MARKAPITFPEVNFSEEGPIRHLHLGSEWIQGSMLVDAPTVLVHEYIQRMMAWLLFVDPQTVKKRQALQLGFSGTGLSRVQQHQMVYDALKGNMGGVLHALALQTSIPD